MPFTLKSAIGHTKTASTPAKQKQWTSTANAVLKKTGDDVKAIKIANASVKRKEKPTMLAKSSPSHHPDTSLPEKRAKTKPKESK